MALFNSSIDANDDIFLSAGRPPLNTETEDITISLRLYVSCLTMWFHSTFLVNIFDVPDSSLIMTYAIFRSY